MPIVIDNEGRRELTDEEYAVYLQNPPIVSTPPLCERINQKLSGSLNPDYDLMIWDLDAKYADNPGGVSEKQFFDSLP